MKQRAGVYGRVCFRGGRARMELYTVSFFGHRRIQDFQAAEARAEKLVRTLLAEKEYVDFLVGREGDWDQIAASAVGRFKRLVRNDNSSLIWVLPYATATLRDNRDDFEAYYDEVEVCEAAAESHPKQAFQIRNQHMVDRSDLAVFYVEHASGGAYQTLRYAQRKKKAVLNLAIES